MDFVPYSSEDLTDSSSLVMECYRNMFCAVRFGLPKGGKKKGLFVFLNNSVIPYALP